MYRRRRSYQQHIERIARGRAAREKVRMECHHPDYPPELPELRRLIEITDYDTGIPITHRIVLYRSNRIDCYEVWLDGAFERAYWLAQNLRRITKSSASA